MHGEEIRQARITAKISQHELARRANVPRSQLARLEKGGNVTVETLKKVLEQLPNLTRVTLIPGKEIAAGGIDLDEVRLAAREVQAASTRLLQALGAGEPAAPEPAAAEAPPAGDHAVEHTPSIDPALVARLEEIVDGLQRRRPRDDS
ncbi:MAG TPA: helix-turn-helix transcriptional regulator [Thermoanaerobaculia bacterium]|nr:helix-turn-helix transcriptional regulator [Thermoanaerobaculia bacterium]